MAKKVVDVEKMEQDGEVIVGIDNNYEEILAFDKKGMDISFDVERFIELDDEQVSAFSPRTQKAYWKAQGRKEAVKPVKREGIEIVENPLGNSSSAYAHRLKIRQRTGWHTYWAKPGADYERCMASGAYTQVRKPSDKQLNEGYEPGYEDGEVLKIMDSEGKVELIALECREEAYQQYLKWMSQQSAMRYGAIKTDYAKATEDINRSAPRGSGKIIPGEVGEDGQFKAF